MMTKGKTICNVLKGIRQKIADANHIEYTPRECHHEGECRGTCPACEAEVRYIERQLSMRRQLGKAVTIAGLSAGIATFTACSNTDNFLPTAGEVMPTETNLQIFGDVMEQMPSFPGGYRALMEWMENNVEYPAEYAETCVQGRVVISFMVEKDGSITDAKIVKSLDSTFDQAALRAVKAMPKWIPGTMNGQRVKTKYTIPIIFKAK